MPAPRGWRLQSVRPVLCCCYGTQTLCRVCLWWWSIIMIFLYPQSETDGRWGLKGFLKKTTLSCILFHPTLLPKPSLGSSCRSLSPPGGAPGLAVHWRQLLYLRLLLATWAVAGLLPGSGRAAQAVLPTHRPPSAASKSYRQPVMTGRQEVRSVHFGHFWQ